MDKEEFPLRHIVLYAKKHYYWNRLYPDLLKICKKINPKASNMKHIIKIVGPVIYAAIQEVHTEGFRVGEGKTVHGPSEEYVDQWKFLLCMREKFEVPWLKYPVFNKLSFEEQKQLQGIFQEEFDNRVLQALISPLIGWIPTIDLGDADSKVLPVVSPPKYDKEKM